MQAPPRPRLFLTSRRNETLNTAPSGEWNEYGVAGTEKNTEAAWTFGIVTNPETLFAEL